MPRSPFLIAALVALMPACRSSESRIEAQESSAAVIPQSSPSDQLPAYAPAVLREPVPTGGISTESEVLDRAARAAWKLIDTRYFPATGFVSATQYYPYPTLWDIASTLVSYYAAHELGYASDSLYHERASKLLETLKGVRLHDGIAYGRNYDARTGELLGTDNKPAANGVGFSATDVGRLLVVLAIIAKHDPSLADAARAVAQRVDGRRVVRRGYLHGQELNARSRRVEQFQEGRLGYEQYAAAGFAFWGMRAPAALDPRKNAKRTSVLGIPVTGDKRGGCLTSEPFIMQGLEVGWDSTMREMAIQTLSVQAQRFATTGQMTMVSEDAINKAPYYFYYYCVYSTRTGKSFEVSVVDQDVVLDSPRWISTKAAFGWYVLFPNRYTWDAVQAVQPALDPAKGWSTGVFEDTKASTKTISLNTAAIILESALYRKTGKPLIY